MPEAIATTKRKFYKALDALTSSTPAVAPKSGSSSSNTPTNKRTSAAAIAFDEARERARKRLRQSTSTTSLSNFAGETIISLPPRAPLQNKDGSAQAPHFSPWSQDKFLARLKTFSSVSLWHPKPDAISEVEWAKRGWVCVDVNTVACKGGCERRVVVSMDMPKKVSMQEEDTEVEDEEDEEVATFEEALAERYKSQIIEGHSPTCMWQKAGCKDDIYRLPVVQPSVWQPELSKRFRSLLAIKPSIEKIATRNTPSTSTTTNTSTLLHDLPQGVIPPEGAANSSAPKALEIALHGWRGSSDSGNDLLNCDACFQRIGLWMYQPSYRRRPTTSLDQSRDTTAEEQDDRAIIDLVEMHRDHCPWRNASTQHATGSLAGLNACQISQRVVGVCARDHRRRSNGLHGGANGDGGEGTPQEEGEGEATSLDPPPKISREEIARQDKERESRLRKLKSLFTIKRKSTSKGPRTENAG